MNVIFRDGEKSADQLKKMKKGAKNPNFSVLEKGKEDEKKTAKKILFTTDGYNVPLNGYCMYFLRTSTKRTLGEETFQVSESIVKNSFISKIE